ncbi:MAG: NUDIX domain-containing protein [Candidatus Nanoarchaeia archaeon]|nr:NUDIX domain-containing protein [Candidatus Nanoarchaeia archaeon]MDD5741702.1 NUDIX domain-containing protein [Candidatus Nanoarchaeia archaeon]
MTRIRRKGIAIIHNPRGILVVSGRNKIYTLPGGGTNKGESRKKATMRELREETGLKTKSIKFLFEYIGKKWHDYKRRSIRNHTKVFLIEAYGRARPRHEIKHIAFWNKKSNIKISKGTKMIIKRLNEKIIRMNQKQ